MWRSAVQLCAGLQSRKLEGGLAQLARATALQAVGQRFDSVILHNAQEAGRSLTRLTEQSRTDDKVRVKSKESKQGRMADA